MIKAEICEPQVHPKWHYPCLGIMPSCGKVVLFTEECYGTVLVDSVSEKGEVGRYYEYWGMSKFVPLKGKLTLENNFE